MEASRSYEELVELADRAMPKQKDPRDMPLSAKLMAAEDGASIANNGDVIDSTANEVGGD